jgi:hypothetical protein
MSLVICNQTLEVVRLRLILCSEALSSCQLHDCNLIQTLGNQQPFLSQPDQIVKDREERVFERDSHQLVDSES